MNWKGLNRYCEEVTVRIVNIALIEIWPTSQKDNRSQIVPNSPEQVDEDEDALHERELNAALDAIDVIREFDLESDDDRNMEDVPIVEEISS